ncbi:FAD-dependent thymidylate synthase [Candidatus Dojkabacteria bacterium]|uniref:Flavin-dependent thymidylate synthase n=1 Tax=Candidatus Dojkabacteria bacterium TaxID=2099670 RepID=A0A3M0YZC2_9BACT|nr:MAG: FAD-dependent thymidylate synthase [Candidatus Dojkabacteria bacterium]
MDCEEFTTKRYTNPDLEKILGKFIQVLDHGFIRLVDYMGGDESIVQAARVSYGKGTKKISQDRGLIRYLIRHRHTTPFEMCEIKFHIKLPIFVARQWIRHRTANVNEYSARYSILDKEFYLPETLESQSKVNNQGRGSRVDQKIEKQYLQLIRDHSISSYEKYLKLLNSNEDGGIIDESKEGIAREIARMVLPVNFFTQWYWKIDLHNLLHFLSLRVDQHAQYEIRVYAEKILEIVKLWVPITYEAFEDYRLKGIFISKQEKQLLDKMIKGQKVTKEDSNLSDREWREFEKKFLNVD